MWLKSENNIVVMSLIHYCVDRLKFYRVKKLLKKNICYFFLKGSYVITKKLLLCFVVMVYFLSLVCQFLVWDLDWALKGLCNLLQE